MEENIKRKKFNICLLGESAVGKTSLTKSLTGESFNQNVMSTIGIDYILHKAIIDGKEFTFKIFDTAGQEKYNSMASSLLHTMDGFLLVFSVDNRQTLEKIEHWINSIEQSVNRNEKAFIVVGNKIDINQRTVSNEEGVNFAHERNMRYFETSARTGFGVKGAFNQIFQDLYELDKKKKKEKRMKMKKIIRELQ